MKKVIWITGASSGFGKDCAAQLLQRDDCIVYVSARRADQMQDLAAAGAQVLAVDVGDDDSVAAAGAEILAREGRIDALLANAGFGAYGMVETMPMSEIQRQFEVNVFGVARCLKAVLPTMRAQRSGRIVITESLAAHASTAGIGWYAASKHALRALHIALRQEVRDLGIQVSAIEPGRVKTGFGAIACADTRVREGEADYRSLTDDFCAYMDKDTFWQSERSATTVAAMIHALTDPKPRRVYRTTLDAKLFPWLLKLLPDAWYDKIILGQLRGSK